MRYAQGKYMPLVYTAYTCSDPVAFPWHNCPLCLFDTVEIPISKCLTIRGKGSKQVDRKIETSQI